VPCSAITKDVNEFSVRVNPTRRTRNFDARRGAERSEAERSERIVASLLVDDPVDFHPRAHARACALRAMHAHFIGPDRSLEV